MVIGHNWEINMSNKHINNIIKYGTRPWIQPVLTSNTSYGIVTVSSYYSTGYEGFRALDFSGTSTMWASANGTGSAWLDWRIGDTLLISSVTIYNYGFDCAGRPGFVRVWTDNSKTVQIGDNYTFFNVSGISHTYTANSPIVSKGIFIEVASGYGYYAGNIGHIVIQAKQL